MKHGLQKKNKKISEASIDQWLHKADIGKIQGNAHFQKTSFLHIKPTDWNKLYEEFQKSKPINIRLPLRIINRLKQVAIEKGIAYQTLIRLWIVERLKEV